MFDDSTGPITHFSWAKFTIVGKEHSKIACETEQSKGDPIISGAGSDIRVIGKEVSTWQERIGHELDINKITGVWDKNIEVLVIGTGVDGLLLCSESLKGLIKEKGIKEIYALVTPKACKLYNDLYQQGEKVALLAHGAC